MASDYVKDPEDPGPCRTCGESFQWHKLHNPVHPFNDGAAGATAFLGKRGDRTHQRAGNGPQRPGEGPSHVVWPSDPVLRIALMNAGVITADHLRAAEEQLRAAMGDVLTKKGDPWSATGEASTDSSTKTDNPSTSP
jgi:hypothetical protein